MHQLADRQAAVIRLIPLSNNHLNCCLRSEIPTLERATWWAVQQGARAAAAARLRTHLGGPTETFAALEAALLRALALLEHTERSGLDASEKAAGHAGGTGGDSSVAALQAKPRRRRSPEQPPGSGSGAAAPVAGSSGADASGGPATAALGKIRVIRKQPAVLAMPQKQSVADRQHISSTESRRSRGAAAPGLPIGGSGGTTAAAASSSRWQSAEAPTVETESPAALRARAALLLEFLAALERILYVAFEGCLGRKPSPAAAATFFVQNRKVPAYQCVHSSCRAAICISIHPRFLSSATSRPLCACRNACSTITCSLFAALVTNAVKSATVHRAVTWHWGMVSASCPDRCARSGSHACARCGCGRPPPPAAMRWQRSLPWSDCRTCERGRVVWPLGWKRRGSSW